MAILFDQISTEEQFEALALENFLPPPRQNLWDWCAGNLAMPNGARWDVRRAGLMRHWYRVANARLSGNKIDKDPYAHRCEQLYLAIAAQLAKTTFCHAILLAALRNYPRTSALYMARRDDVNNARDRKLKRQVEKTPALDALLPRGTEARERALGQRSWAIGSAVLNFRVASVADDLRADAIELMVLDEFDTYPKDVEGYGDPIDQALARQRTFPRSRLLLGPSTPGFVSGHGWSRTCSGSHERLLVDCPHCGGAQDLDFRRVTLAGGRDLEQVLPSEISSEKLGRFACLHCGTLLNSEEIHAAVRSAIDADRMWCPGAWTQDEQHPHGKWSPHAKLDSGGRLLEIEPTSSVVRSGQASSLYSLDETLDSFASRLAASKQGSLSKQKTFTNNECAEPWIQSVTEADTDDILESTKPADAYRIGTIQRPAESRYKLFLMFDQQGNTRENYWFPWVLRAFDPGVGSWLVAEGIAKNNDEADALEQKTWSVGGEERKADRVGRDSGNGNYLFDAYLWASKRPSIRILLRGDHKLSDGVPWQEVVDQPNVRRKTPKPAGVREFKISPHYWRNILWDQIRGKTTTRWYLPDDASDRYKASLTSEEQVVESRRVAGGGSAAFRDVIVWRPRVVHSVADRHTVRKDNHWWDAEASALAAANILHWDRTPPKAPTAPVGKKPTQGFMDGYV